MQYPLEKLSSFITHQHTASAQVPPQQFEDLCRVAQYDICVYMSTAQNVQQAAFMLHALKVVILNMQNNLRNQRQLENEYDTTAGNHELQSDELEKLQKFLDEQFAAIITYPLPYSLNKPATEPSEKQVLQTNLSVPQLGLFLRLLIETGILEEGKNIAALMSKIAGSVKTRKTQQISSESLRIKYYTPEKAAVNIIREYLLQMMRSLREF